MSNTVYLVSSGEYSNYSVHAAFTTEELAQAWIDRQLQDGSRHYDEYTIEGHGLDPTPASLPEMSWYVVTVHHPDLHHPRDPSWRRYDERPTWFDGIGIETHTYSMTKEALIAASWLQYMVRARNAEEAVLSAELKRVELVETGEWNARLARSIDDAAAQGRNGARRAQNLMAQVLNGE